MPLEIPGRVPCWYLQGRPHLLMWLALIVFSNRVLSCEFQLLWCQKGSYSKSQHSPSFFLSFSLPLKNQFHLNYVKEKLEHKPQWQQWLMIHKVGFKRSRTLLLNVISSFSAAVFVMISEIKTRNPNFCQTTGSWAPDLGDKHHMFGYDMKA